MTADRAALVEKVAIVIVCKLVEVADPDTRISQLTNEELKEFATAAIALIRAEVLEEAARVVKSIEEEAYYYAASEGLQLLSEAADAIRALANPGNAS